jgi:glycosyltransferase involved in cell wall biosynthesis
MPSVIALLGVRDEPTDGVTDYCAFLGRALSKHGFELRAARVPWDKLGWLGALLSLIRESAAWRGQSVFLQYTAMAWSRRGFPIGALLSVAILRLRGARCGIVFHEPTGNGGSGLLGSIRTSFQTWNLRMLHRLAAVSIFTIPLNTVRWLPAGDAHSTFIPLGPNIVENLAHRVARSNQSGTRRTVVVFCLSDPPHQQKEVADILNAVRVVADDGINLRLVFVGRGTSEAKNTIDSAFQGTDIEICNRGLCEAEEVTRIFSESDAMLAVRGGLYLRRGSALAGLACGLPIVGYEGAIRGTIVEDAGIALVPVGDHQALGSALRDILANAALWQQMHERSLHIQRKYLSWDVIGAQFIRLLSVQKGGDESPTVL